MTEAAETTRQTFDQVSDHSVALQQKAGELQTRVNHFLRDVKDQSAA